jgi:hypothetical protein
MKRFDTLKRVKQKFNEFYEGLPFFIKFFIGKSMCYHIFLSGITVHQQVQIEELHHMNKINNQRLTEKEI